MEREGNDDSPFQPSGHSNSALSRWSRAINQRYQLLLDLWTPHLASRWCFSVFILLLFMIRVVVAQGFLSPKIDPAFQSDDFDDDDQSGPMLPTSANEEFRPFIRRLPEFKFWLQATRATLFSLFLSMFRIFDLPVFWPILLLYFIVLFIMTMRQQIKHMWKYRYVPWSRGKQRYGGNVGGTREDSARLFGTPT